MQVRHSCLAWIRDALPPAAAFHCLYDCPPSCSCVISYDRQQRRPLRVPPTLVVCTCGLWFCGEGCKREAALSGHKVSCSFLHWLNASSKELHRSGAEAEESDGGFCGFFLPQQQQQRQHHPDRYLSWKEIELDGTDSDQDTISEYDLEYWDDCDPQEEVNGVGLAQEVADRDRDQERSGQGSEPNQCPVRWEARLPLQPHPEHKPPSGNTGEAGPTDSSGGSPRTCCSEASHTSFLDPLLYQYPEGGALIEDDDYDTWVKNGPSIPGVNGGR